MVVHVDNVENSYVLKPKLLNLFLVMYGEDTVIVILQYRCRTARDHCKCSFWWINDEYSMCKTVIIILLQRFGISGEK